TEDRTGAPPAHATPTARLVVFCDGRVETHALPDEGALVVGRSEECDVRIDHTTVSRKHAVLYAGPTLGIEDLRSSNGTRGGGVVAPANERVLVRAGVTVELGSVLVVIQPGSASAAEAAGARSVEPPGPTWAPESPMEQLRPLIDRVAASPLIILLLG